MVIDKITPYNDKIILQSSLEGIYICRVTFVTSRVTFVTKINYLS